MTIANNSINGAGGGGIGSGISLNAVGLMGMITLNNFHIYGNAILNVSNPFNPGSYTNITGRVVTGIGEFLQTSNTQSHVDSWNRCVHLGRPAFGFGILLPLRDYLQSGRCRGKQWNFCAGPVRFSCALRRLGKDRYGDFRLCRVCRNGFEHR